MLHYFLQFWILKEICKAFYYVYRFVLLAHRQIYSPNVVLTVLIWLICDQSYVSMFTFFWPISHFNASSVPAYTWYITPSRYFSHFLMSTLHAPYSSPFSLYHASHPLHALYSSPFSLFHASHPPSCTLPIAPPSHCIMPLTTPSCSI